MKEFSRRQWIQVGHIKADMPEKSELFTQWESLFQEYNEDPNNRKLGMSCSPCYDKVYAYHNKTE